MGMTLPIFEKLPRYRNYDHAVELRRFKPSLY